MPSLFLGALTSYLLGSIPTGYIAGRLLGGLDLRKVGSGNPGTTNVYRNLGWGPAVVVFAIDVSKGLVPVVWLPALFFPGDPAGGTLLLIYRIVLGLAAIAGHVWTVFLAFRGGKGVGTAFGVFLGLTPEASLLALAVWGIVVLSGGIVSLGSLCAALSFPLFLLLTESGILEEHLPLFLFGSATTLLVLYTHRTNIVRLVRGEEKSLKKKKGGRGG